MTKEEFVRLVYLNLKEEISTEEFKLLNDASIAHTDLSDLRAEIEAAWDDAIDELPAEGSASKQAFKKLNQRINKPNSTFAKILKLRYSPAIAAVALLVLAAAFLFGEGYSSFSTGNQSKHFVLEDGSEIWLAPHSEMKYKEAKNRRVKLKGSAYFEVAKDLDRPFVITTKTTKTTVLGTRFALTKGDSSVILHVDEGKVAFESTISNESRIVNGSESAIIDIMNGDIEMSAYQQNYSGLYTGKFVFTNQKLSSVLKELSNLYEIEIIANSSAVADCSFTGRLVATDVEQLVNQIADYFDATVIKSDLKIVLENGECK